MANTPTDKPNTTEKNTTDKIVSDVAASGFPGTADNQKQPADSPFEDETNTSKVAEFNRTVRSKEAEEFLRAAQTVSKSEIVEIMDFSRASLVQVGVKSGSYMKEKKGGVDFVNTNDIPGSIYIDYGKTKMKLSFTEGIGLANDILEKVRAYPEYATYCLKFEDDIREAKNKGGRLSF